MVCFTAHFYDGGSRILAPTVSSVRGLFFYGEGDGNLYAVRIWDAFSESGMNYKITSVEPLEVALVGSEDPSVETVAIEGTIGVHGHILSVTSCMWETIVPRQLRTTSQGTMSACSQDGSTRAARSSGTR